MESAREKKFSSAHDSRPFFFSTALFFSCYARALADSSWFLVRDSSPIVQSFVRELILSFSLVEETGIPPTSVGCYSREYSVQVVRQRSLSRQRVVTSRKIKKDRGFVPRGWLPPPRETPVARVNAVFYKLPSRLYSFRVHRRRSIYQVFEIFRKVRGETVLDFDADWQSVFTAWNDRRVRRGSVVIAVRLSADGR